MGKMGEMEKMRACVWERIAILARGLLKACIALALDSGCESFIDKPVELIPCEVRS